jgi:23S rRNA pseudouridine955/2504/2580 synthase
MFPQERELELVHRLDRDTSGLIMVARRRSFLRKLQRLMQGGQIEKRYWLLCQGFKGKERTLDAPLLKMMNGNERIVRVSREGKPSVTHFRLLERFAQAQLVEATLETGRTHQIRVHSQFGGFALLGDSKYGIAKGEALLAEIGRRRLCLHARTLVFVHPNTGKRLTVTAPLDDDYEAILTALRSKP